MESVAYLHLLCVMLMSNSQPTHSLSRYSLTFHHISSISDISLPIEMLKTSVEKIPISGIIECSVKCLGLVDCLMFGVDEVDGFESSPSCLLWIPDPMGSINQTIDITSSGLYVRDSLGIPRDCAGLQDAGITNDGPFWVFLHGKIWTRVYCDFHTDGGGWTIIQRRRYGGIDFYQNWADYKKGFGDIYKDFWLGNENLNLLTTQDTYQLRVDLWKFSGEAAFAKYKSFKIEDEKLKYKLILGDYLKASTAGDSLTYHNDKYFSTKDRDNDGTASHCAVLYKGAWWYYQCYQSSLNGPWKTTTSSNMQTITWYSWTKNYKMPLMSEMKIRPESWKV